MAINFKSLFASQELKLSPQVLRLTSGEWKPLLSKNLPNHGFASAIVAASFDAVGHRVEWGFFPWKRSYIYARSGQWDGSVVWVKTPEREKYFSFSDPVIIDNEYIYSKKSKPIEWSKIEDLRQYTLSLTLHAVYPALEDEISAGNIVVYRKSSYDSLIPRVIGGRSDGAVITNMVGEYFLRQHPIARSKISRDETVLWRREYHLMISKKIEGHKKIIADFNRGLAKIKSNGGYEKIYRMLKQGGYDREPLGILNDNRKAK